MLLMKIILLSMISSVKQGIEFPKLELIKFDGNSIAYTKAFSNNRPGH